MAFNFQANTGNQGQQQGDKKYLNPIDVLDRPIIVFPIQHIQDAGPTKHSGGFRPDGRPKFNDGILIDIVDLLPPGGGAPQIWRGQLWRTGSLIREFKLYTESNDPLLGMVYERTPRDQTTRSWQYLHQDANVLAVAEAWANSPDGQTFQKSPKVDPMSFARAAQQAAMQQQAGGSQYGGWPAGSVPAGQYQQPQPPAAPAYGQQPQAPYGQQQTFMQQPPTGLPNVAQQYQQAAPAVAAAAGAPYQAPPQQPQFNQFNQPQQAAPQFTPGQQFTPQPLPQQQFNQPAQGGWGQQQAQTAPRAVGWGGQQAPVSSPPAQQTPLQAMLATGLVPGQQVAPVGQDDQPPF